MVALSTLRERLNWDLAHGALHDGPQRWLVVRPDLLTGMIGGLTEAMRLQVLLMVDDSPVVTG